MKRRITKTHAVSILLLMLLLLTTCTAAGDAPTQELSGTVRIAYAGAPADDAINPLDGRLERGFNTFFQEAFLSKHPNLKVEITTVPWTDYETKLQSMLMADAVDVLGSGGSEKMFYQQGYIREIDDLLAADTEYKPEEHFVGAAWNDCVFNSTADGKRFGLPAAMGQRMIIYDKKLFDDWGVEYLSEYPTPEEILEKAAKMTGINPVTGEENYGLYFKGNNLANSLWTTLNMRYDSPGYIGERTDDYKNITFALNTPGIVKTMDFLKAASKFCNPGFVTNQGEENFGTELNDSAIYLEYNGSKIMGGYYASGNTDTSMIERFVPVMNMGPNGGGWLAVDSIVIAKNAQNIEASWEVAKFMASDEFFEYVYKDLGWLSAGKNTSFFDPNDIYSEVAVRIAEHAGPNIHDSVPEFHAQEILPFVTGFIAQAALDLAPDSQTALDQLQATAEKWQAGLK